MKPPKITVDNFHISSYGVWDEVAEIPNFFVSVFKSKKGSEYFVNPTKDTIIRKSDHWGRNIKNCDWYLWPIDSDAPIMIDCGYFYSKFGKKQFIGMISISDLSYKEPKYLKPKVKLKPATKKKAVWTDSVSVDCDHWEAKLIDGFVHVFNKKGGLLRKYPLLK